MAINPFNHARNDECLNNTCTKCTSEIDWEAGYIIAKSESKEEVEWALRKMRENHILAIEKERWKLSGHSNETHYKNYAFLEAMSAILDISLDTPSYNKLVKETRLDEASWWLDNLRLSIAGGSGEVEFRRAQNRIAELELA